MPEICGRFHRETEKRLGQNWVGEDFGSIFFFGSLGQSCMVGVVVRKVDGRQKISFITFVMAVYLLHCIQEKHQ